MAARFEPLSMLTGHLRRWLESQRSNRSSRLLPSLPILIGTDRGLTRDENQDRVAAIRVPAAHAEGLPFVVVAIADGMGGLDDGAACAELTIAAFFDAILEFKALLPEQRLFEAAHAANKEVHRFAAGKGGSTLTAIMLHPYGCFAVNIGDSRIYVRHGSPGSYRIDRATVDDNLAEAFGGEGNELLQFVGVGRGLRPHVKRLESTPELILLTTDGIHFLKSDLLVDIVTRAPDGRVAAERLFALARWLGSPDNASVAAISPRELTLDPTGDDKFVEIFGLEQNSALLQVAAHHHGPEPESQDKTRKTDRSRRARPSRSRAPEPNDQLKIEINVSGADHDGDNS